MANSVNHTEASIFSSASSSLSDSSGSNFCVAGISVSPLLTLPLRQIYAVFVNRILWCIVQLDFFHVEFFEIIPHFIATDSTDHSLVNHPPLLRPVLLPLRSCYYGPLSSVPLQASLQAPLLPRPPLPPPLFYVFIMATAFFFGAENIYWPLLFSSTFTRDNVVQVSPVDYIYI